VRPARAALEAAAGAPARRGCGLSAAGRALEKHVGRRGAGWGASFWGEERRMGGGDAAKNARAAERVCAVLDDAVWWNVLSLPGGEPALEVRVADGYGARWHFGTGSFRGFLEPHCEALADRW
jgi:hypothetical protein